MALRDCETSTNPRLSRSDARASMPHRRSVIADAHGQGHSAAILQRALRCGLIAAACAGVAGCAVLPALGVSLAAQTAPALAMLALGPMDAANQQKDLCGSSGTKGIAITESLETTPPGTEGDVQSYQPVYWRTEFASAGYPEIERARTPVEGMFALTEKSVFFVPPAGATSVRIPLELVQDAEVRAGTGVPGVLVIKSCAGRFDLVIFAQRSANPQGPDTATAVAVLLKERMTKVHAATVGR